ncbi:MAG: arginase family protein [Deltaproteobacteria bacterium]|nr:arginase family protein [Deltaproteobacteria bacterium]
MMAPPFLTAENLPDATRAWAVVVPVPFDRCAAPAPGARLAPAEIVAASHQVETHDLEAGCDPTDRGLFTAPPLELDYSTEDVALAPIGDAVEAHARAGRFALLLGGEATVLAGSARGLARLGRGGVVRLEGVLGCEDVRHGLRAVPRTATRRASELLPVRSSGWRLAAEEARAFATGKDLAGPTARRLAARPGVAPATADEVVAGLPQDVWLALDLGVLDPSALPMPGNLEPGGLAYADLTALLTNVFASRRVLGAELTGLCPPTGDVLPAFVAARLGLRILALAHRQRFPGGDGRR